MAASAARLYQLSPEYAASVQQRFWKYIDQRSVTECWMWIGSISNVGYGQLSVKNKPIHAHRISAWIHRMIVHDGMVINHLCGCKPCANPSHLEVTTESGNIKHAYDTGLHRLKTTCPRGHPYTPENTRILPKSGRRCVTCTREQARGYARIRRAKLKYDKNEVLIAVL